MSEPSNIQLFIHTVTHLVDQTNPDVQMITEAARGALEDALRENLEQRELTAQNADLFRRSHEQHREVLTMLHESTDTNRVLRTVLEHLAADLEQADRDLSAAAARIRELETHLRAERQVRMRAEAARDQAATTAASTAAPVDTGELQRLRDELAEMTADRDLHAALLDQAEEERRTVIRVRAHLTARLAELQPDQVNLTDEPAEPDAPPPGTFGDVLDQGAHPLLAFTLDLAIPAGLDGHPSAPAWRRRTAETLATMAAYAAAKAKARAAGHQPGPELADLLAFVRHGGPGVILPAGAIALGESRQVNGDPRYANARLFACPDDVDPTRTAAMFAHVRIGGVQPPAPRLHFHDDTTGTGRIVIGYLGPHLPTRRTN